MTSTIVAKDTYKEEHLRSSDFITDIVIGMSDGLTVPFALAAGLSGAVHRTLPLFLHASKAFSSSP